MECPLKKLWNVNCRWTGPLAANVGHVKDDHYDDCLKHSGEFIIKLYEVSPQKHYHKMIFTLGKMFCFLWEIKNATFYFALFRIRRSPVNEHNEFKYMFKIAKGYKSILIYGISHSFLKDKNEVMQSGECVALNYSAVSKYLSEDGSLLCEIEIIPP
jgi:hypothetical protein